MKCDVCGLLGKPTDFFDLVYDEIREQVAYECVCPRCKAIKHKECYVAPALMQGDHVYNLDGICINCGDVSPFSKERLDGISENLKD